MSPVAEQLDRQLRTLPAELASSVEQVVWDLLKVAAAKASVERNDDEIRAHRSHLEECMRISADLDWTEFGRPDQGLDEIRPDV